MITIIQHQDFKKPNFAYFNEKLVPLTHYSFQRINKLWSNGLLESKEQYKTADLLVTTLVKKEDY